MSTAISESLALRIEAAGPVVLGQRDYFRAHFGKVESLWKADGSRVTKSDLEITQAILGRLTELFPEDVAVSEETDPGHGAVRLDRGFSWILDPVDGTNNYALAIPSCAISLGLLFEGRAVGGWIYDYARDCLICGGPGWGAFDGERSARVLPGAPGRQSPVGMNAPFDWERIPEVDAVMRNHKIRCLGSSTLHLAYAGIGLFHGALDHNVKLWDIAAAAAVVEGAGGEFRPLDLAVFPAREFSVSSPKIRFVAGSREACDALEAGLRAPRR